jgi:hypothetical protein
MMKYIYRPKAAQPIKFSTYSTAEELLQVPVDYEQDCYCTVVHLRKLQQCDELYDEVIQ